jgi:hypothetical protein
LEDEAKYLTPDLSKLIKVDKEVCSRPEVQKVLKDYMKGYWDK